MYIQGVSTRKVKVISEKLCGHSFSASAISEINKKLDEELGRFARRDLDSEYPYLIIDARYEKVREKGVIHSRTVLVAIGIDWGRPASGARSGNGQSGELCQLERLSARAENTRPTGRIFRRQ
jgi:transposase-like protein